MKQNIQNTFLAFLFLFTNTLNVFAEGTKQLTPTSTANNIEVRLVSLQCIGI